MWSLFEGTAWAQSVASGAQGSEYSSGCPTHEIISMVREFSIFSSSARRAQKASEHRKMLGALKKNDEVVKHT